MTDQLAADRERELSALLEVAFDRCRRTPQRGLVYIHLTDDGPAEYVLMSKERFDRGSNPDASWYPGDPLWAHEHVRPEDIEGD